MPMKAVFLVLGALLLPTAASAKTWCYWGAWSVSAGGTGIMHVNTLSGVDCRMNRSLRAGPRDVLRSVVIASKPANGVATASGYVVTYRSRPRFVGRDSFVFLINGSQGTFHYTSTVRVEVVVTDRL
jgi:hypothetical protein